MKKMKKYIALVLAVMVVFIFTACSKEQGKDISGEQNNAAEHVGDNSNSLDNLTNNEGEKSEDVNNSSSHIGNSQESEESDSSEDAITTDKSDSGEVTEAAEDSKSGEGTEPSEKPDNSEDTKSTAPTAGGGTDAEEKPDSSGDIKLADDESTKGIIKISRQEAGLSTIPELDFSRFALNPSIQRVIEEPASYTNHDYKNGLINENFLIVTERFNENIIQDIAIGDNISKVSETLGAPSCIIGNTMFYKTKDYYLGIKGKEKVEQAVFSRKPRQYPSTILKALVTKINEPEFSSIIGLLSENNEISEFFDHNGHIHGGGWYAFAMNGIYLEEFTENSITVYNNFEGDLYKLQDDNFQYGIVYSDIDYMMDNMVSELNGYNWTNRIFNEDGIISPGGKYDSVYVWNYSESYYFIIRSMDNNHPDVYIGLPATGDYYWLNDRYILYSDFFSFAPILLDVETFEIINVLEETNLFDVDDYGFYSFKIKSYNDGLIIVYHEDEDKQYRIGYSFDQNGQIQLISETLNE